MIGPLKQFIYFAEHSSEAWCAKDTSSRFLYANQAYRELFGLPRDFKIEGLRVGELPVPVAEFEKEFEESDRLVETIRDVRQSLEIHPSGKDQLLSPWYFNKYPLFNENEELIGTTVHGYPALDLRFTGSKVDARTLVYGVPNDTLSKEEWKFVHFAATAHSIEEIADLSGIALATISSRQDAVFRKLGIDTLDQLKEMITANGWDRYIPVDLMGERYIRLW